MRRSDDSYVRKKVRTGMLVGLDLDNTIIDYHSIFLKLARESGVVGPGEVVTRNEMRSRTWKSPRGDELWQEFQAAAYGDRILEATFFQGVLECIEEARARGVQLKIISHKTERSNIRSSINLREKALDWLGANGLFDPPYLFKASDVLFASTREEKVDFIRGCQCAAFVDDLVEVLGHPNFPDATKRILFAPQLEDNEGPPLSAGIIVATSWKQVGAILHNGI